MDEVGILEARNTLSALIERVERGEEVTITRHGKPVAKLVSTDSDEDRKARVRAAIEWIRANRTGNALDGRIDQGHDRGRPAVLSFVVDASVIFAWQFPDEESEVVDQIVDMFMDRTAWVPAHWHAEIANGFAIAVRRKRLTRDYRQGAADADRGPADQDRPPPPS